MAKSDGLRVLADAAPADRQLVGSLGADEVVQHGDDVVDRFRALAPDGVDAVLDGAALNELILPAIRDGGALAVIRGWSGPVDRGINLQPILVTEAATDYARPLWLRDQASMVN